MGNVVLEAMAGGCPVVVPRAGGIPSLLAHGVSGLLYEPRETQDAAGCVQRILSDETLRATLARAGRDAVEGRSWEYSVGRVRQVYADAIREGPRLPDPAKWSDRVAQNSMVALVSLFRSLARKEKRIRHPRDSRRTARRARPRAGTHAG